MTVAELGFDEIMTEAQLANQGGDFGAAREGWRQAQSLAPDQSEYARALRGEAASAFRGAQNDAEVGVAMDVASNAIAIHRGLYEQNPTSYDALRQVPESVRVLGRMQLLWSLRAERTDGRIRGYGLGAARATMLLGDFAIGCMRQQPQPDQHEVNWWPTRAVVEALTPGGDKKWALEQARRARTTSRVSESPVLPTSAGISAEYAATANRTARIRALAAETIVRLATPHQTLRRRAAVWLATRGRLI